MLNRENKILARYQDVIKNFPFFKGLAPKDLESISKSFRVERWKKGYCGLTEEIDKRFHLLASGRLEVTRSNPETGRTVTLWLLKPGDVFDIVSFLDGRPHSIIPLAVDDVEILYTSMDTARKWLDEYPELCRNILPYLGEKFREIENLAADLAIHDTMTRIARLILRHAEPIHEGADTNHSPVRLIHDLSHEALARMVGSVRVVVNRHLNMWKEKGIIDYKRGEMVIKDLEALSKRAKALLESLRKRQDKRRTKD